MYVKLGSSAKPSQLDLRKECREQFPKWKERVQNFILTSSHHIFFNAHLQHLKNYKTPRAHSKWSRAGVDRRLTVRAPQRTDRVLPSLTRLERPTSSYALQTRQTPSTKPMTTQPPPRDLALAVAVLVDQARPGLALASPPSVPRIKRSSVQSVSPVASRRQSVSLL